MTLREFLKMFQYDKSDSYMIKITKEDDTYTFDITNTQDLMCFADWNVVGVSFSSCELTITIEEQ